MSTSTLNSSVRSTAIAAAQPRWGRASWAFWLALALPSLFIGAHALRYLATGPEGVLHLNHIYEIVGMQGFNDFVAEQLPKFKQHPLLLYLHITGMGTALAIGGLQFVPMLRRRKPRLHRAVGRVYMPAALVGSLAGGIFAVSLPAEPGLPAVLAIVGVASTTFAFTALGALRLWQGDYLAHGEWMIRSYSQTLSGTTLRMMIPLMDHAGLPWHENYLTALWMCWVPNLFVAELLIHYRRCRREGRALWAPAPRVAMP